METDNRAGSAASKSLRSNETKSGPESSVKARIYIAIDIESTGIEADTGEIIEIAVLRFRLEPGGQPRILEEWQTFVRPQNPIPYKITNLTGIRQSDVEHAPGFNQIRERLRQILGNFPIVGHSVESDIGFLRRHQYEVQNPALDTYELATLIMPQLTNYSLKAVAETLGVRAGEAHRAMADARMTMNIFAALVSRIEQLPPEVLAEVDRVAAELLGEWSLHRLFQTARQIQQQEMATGGASSNLGALLKMKLAEQHRQPASKNDNLGFLFLAEETLPPALEPQPLPPEVLAKFDNRVAVAIREAFSRHRHLLLEAPDDRPGSEHERALGMLVAGVEAARRDGKCVVLAFNNETRRNRMVQEVIPDLQAQLVRLEMPDSQAQTLVRKRRQHDYQPFRVAEVKNQTNYLCLRRWESFRKTSALTDEELKLLIKVLVWLPGTTQGDISELRSINGERLWSRINSQPGLCLPEFCDRPGSPRCFYYRARERARNSHLVIADQALVLSDLVGQAGTLPPTDYIIVDDAHQLEDEASRQFGHVITPYSLFNYLDWLSRPVTWKPDGKQERTGFLHNLNRYFKKDTPPEVRTVLTRVATAAVSQVDLCREAAGNFLRDLSTIVAQHNQLSGQADGRVRLDDKFRQGPLWAESMGMWDSVHQQWEELYYRLAELRDESDAVEPVIARARELHSDLVYYVNQCNFLLNKMAAAFETGEPGQVFWLGTTRLHAASSAAQALAPEGESPPLNDRPAISIYDAPLEIAPVLEQELFNRKRSVALISSTLTTENDFNFIKDRLGLDQLEPMEVRLVPQRDYSATLLFLPGDMPEPNQPGYQKSIDQQLLELARASGSRVVAIFASNSALRLTYKAIQRPLEGQNILVLGQGMDGTRRSMMLRFRSTAQAVLLTTLNFWETTELQPSVQSAAGPEDEAGAENGLFNLLVITKLPFDPPSDPVFAARVESKLFERPFEQYGLPRTILRFRQAFERLLAGQTERGAVVMLDSRLLTKQYGSLFLNSLPPLTNRADSLNQMQNYLKDWLK